MVDASTTAESGAPVALSEPVLDRLFPRAPSAARAAFVNEVGHLKASGVDGNQRRLAMFLAQIGVESGGLTRVTENLNYTAKRLVQVWPNRFADEARALPFAGAPERLANLIYGGRMGNDEAGDGWRYRGRGYLSLTGRDAYRIVGALVGMPFEDNPDLVASDQGAVASACGVWVWKHCNAMADAGDIIGCSRAINGGDIGLSDRIAFYKLALLALNGDLK